MSEDKAKRQKAKGKREVKREYKIKE